MSRLFKPRTCADLCPRSRVVISALAAARPWMSEAALKSCLWRAPFSWRGEPKLNKYSLHPVCIKGLHTWLWRQSDIKQGGVAQPAPTGTCTSAHTYTQTHTPTRLAIKSLSFFLCILSCFYSFPSRIFFPSDPKLRWHFSRLCPLVNHMSHLFCHYLSQHINSL